jgi:adenine-specific DNA-methyltransferase
MSLKQTVLTALETEQLKGLCAEFELEADRRSREAMIAALSGSKRAKPELLIVKLSAIQLRAVLNQFEQPTDGRKEELVQRLIAASGRALPEATTAKSSASDLAAEYRHRDLAVQRPEAGVQDHFQPKKSPSVYRYDSSLDPVLSWDEQRERDLGEWLLGLIVRAAKVGEAAVFAEPQVWKGGGVRVSIFVRCSSDAAADRQGLPQLGRQGRAARNPGADGAAVRSRTAFDEGRPRWHSPPQAARADAGPIRGPWHGHPRESRGLRA